MSVATVLKVKTVALKLLIESYNKKTHFKKVK